MRVAVAGTGYVGLICAVGFASLGHKVICIDTDSAKVASINEGRAPIHELDLPQKLSFAVSNGSLSASTDYEAISGSEVVFICVGTPAAPDGSQDTRALESCAKSVVSALKKEHGFFVIAVRSTVLPGSTEKLVGRIIESGNGEYTKAKFGLAMIPEFLREGCALQDFMNPARLVIGTDNEETRKRLEPLLISFSCPRMWTTIAAAEMIKYASNAFLATKLCTLNEISDVCLPLGLDIDEIAKGVGLDPRIGPEFMNAGTGFGGSCLPKDLSALCHRVRNMGLELKVLEAVRTANSKRQTVLAEMLMKSMDPKGKRIAVLGLSFKPSTDDIRESAAIGTIKLLLDAGATIQAYDPAAMASMRMVFPDIEYCNGWAECLRGVDAALIVTPWSEFRKSAQEYAKALGRAPLIDAYRILGKHEAAEAGLEYHCVGRG